MPQSNKKQIALEAIPRRLSQKISLDLFQKAACPYKDIFIALL